MLIDLVDQLIWSYLLFSCMKFIFLYVYMGNEISAIYEVPVHQRYRCIPPSEYEAPKAHIHQLLEAQVIRESRSPFASSLVLVKESSLRLCVDYRHLNSKTHKDTCLVLDPGPDCCVQPSTHHRKGQNEDWILHYHRAVQVERDAIWAVQCPKY